MNKMAWHGSLEDIYKHIETFNHEMGAVQKDVAAMTVDLVWLKKIQWWQFALMLSGFSGLALLILFRSG